MPSRFRVVLAVRLDLGITPRDEHKEHEEHEAASEAETEAEPERKGERIASVGNVGGGRECWR